MQLRCPSATAREQKAGDAKGQGCVLHGPTGWKSGHASIPGAWDSCSADDGQAKPRQESCSGGRRPFLRKMPLSVYQSSRKLNSKLSPQTTTVCGCLRHPSELSRSGCKPMTHGLSAVLAAIWQSVTIPLRPYGSVVIPSGKRRGVAGPAVIREALHCSTARVVVLILQRSPTQWKLEHPYLLSTNSHETISLCFESLENAVMRLTLGDPATSREIQTVLIGSIASKYTYTVSVVKRGGACLSSLLKIQE